MVGTISTELAARGPHEFITSGPERSATFMGVPCTGLRDLQISTDSGHAITAPRDADDPYLITVPDLTDMILTETDGPPGTCRRAGCRTRQPGPPSPAGALAGPATSDRVARAESLVPPRGSAPRHASHVTRAPQPRAESLRDCDAGAAASAGPWRTSSECADRRMSLPANTWRSPIGGSRRPIVNGRRRSRRSRNVGAGRRRRPRTSCCGGDGAAGCGVSEFATERSQFSTQR
jgi:hypothetical protein